MTKNSESYFFFGTMYSQIKSKFILLKNLNVVVVQTLSPTLTTTQQTPSSINVIFPILSYIIGP